MLQSWEDSCAGKAISSSIVVAPPSKESQISSLKVESGTLFSVMSLSTPSINSWTAVYFLNHLSSKASILWANRSMKLENCVVVICSKLLTVVSLSLEIKREKDSWSVGKEWIKIVRMNFKWLEKMVWKVEESFRAFIIGAERIKQVNYSSSKAKAESWLVG